MTLPDGAASVYAVATRISQLSADGSVAVGAPTYTTDQLVKFTFAPAMETGDDLVLKNALGNIAVRYKHGDMAKYYTAQIELATPDPAFESLLCGGSLLGATATALASPGTVTATPAITGGSLPAGSYGYKVSAYNSYGETLASTEATATVASGVAGTVSLSWAAVTGAVGYRIYGRAVGGEQLMGSQLVAGSVTPFVDTGSVTPFGALPTSNTSAGIAGVGYAAPNMGITGNPTGVSIELYAMAIVNGVQPADKPFYRWVFPKVTNLHQTSRDFTNAIATSMYAGEVFENPNWSSGPFSDWPFPSTQVFQRARIAAAMVPTVGFASTPATA